MTNPKLKYHSEELATDALSFSWAVRDGNFKLAQARLEQLTRRLRVVMQAFAEAKSEAESGDGEG